MNNEENDSSQLIKRIAELEAIVTGKDIVESAGWRGSFSAYQFNQRKAVEAERDQLTADYESLLVDHNELLAEYVRMSAENMKLAANLAAEKDEVDLKKACISGMREQSAKLAANLETARKALTNIRDYIRSNSGADWDNVRAFCLEALAQGTHRL